VTLNLIKLSVGTRTPEQLEAWQRRTKYTWGPEKLACFRHVTRNMPRRGDEIITGGGSLYWVIKGVIRVRNRILAFEPVAGKSGRPKCAIVMLADPVRTFPVRHRIFQGWRYFEGPKVPADLAEAMLGDEPPPPEVLEELKELGLI